MNKIYNIFIPLLVCLFSACEVITEENQLIPVSQSGKATVLLTEFTGIGCVNCPKAATEAQRLMESYGKQLVVVEMHPPTNPFTEAVEQFNYTCNAADKYYLQYGGTVSTPLPTGVINGKKINNSYFTDYQLWGAAAAKEAERQTDISIQVSAQLVANALTVKVEADNKPEEAMLLIWLTEDSLVGPQLMPDGTVNQTYVHNHVLREELYSGYAFSNHTFEFDISDKYNYENCSVIAVLCNTDGTVLTANAEHLSLQQEEKPLTIIVDGIGSINNDTTIVITEAYTNAITGKPEMQITGMLTYQGQLTVNIERENPDIDDQFCCADQCINTNYEAAQQLTFSVNGVSKWFAHYSPQAQGDAAITYIFSPKGVNRKLKIIYKYNM